MAKKKSSLAELVRSEYGTREPKYSIKKAAPNTPVKGKRDFKDKPFGAGDKPFKSGKPKPHRKGPPRES